MGSNGLATLLMSSKMSVGQLLKELILIYKALPRTGKLSTLGGRDLNMVGYHNCDRACKEHCDIAVCDGLISDLDGRWIKGFKRKIGLYGALHAKM